MMTLGNMRANGVQTVAIHRGGRWCNYEAISDVSGYGDEPKTSKNLFQQ
jgi:hypothetical protein